MKMLIGSLVGGLILFFWQFASWGPLNLHSSVMEYHPQQDQIISDLSKHIDKEGTYFIPRADPSASAEEMERQSQAGIGKPWAIVSYHNNMQNTFAMNLIRGFVMDFLAVFMLIFILLKFENKSFQNILISSLFVGLIGYFYISYLDSIWFQSNSIPVLIDAIVQWGLCGAWLGWWLNRD